MGPPPPPGPDDADAEAAAAAAAPRRLAAYHGALVAALAEDAAKCADDYCADCWAATHARGTPPSPLPVQPPSWRATLPRAAAH